MKIFSPIFKFKPPVPGRLHIRVGGGEGSRFYKINGYYYIFATQYAEGEYVLRSTSLWGPYTLQRFAVNLPSPITPEPTGGNPHQGGIVDTQNGDWMGYRYGIFNYATQSLGGLVTVDSFTMMKP